ncbi:MAG: DNA polymerase I [Candidatus Gastranaerophilales bacterium]|nr:DNA polymerase I [Candidatus Gastranaerophilales bacterium]
MEKQKTLILIDGHALAYRMYYALERTGMRTSSGQPTWAIYGFFKALFDLLKKVKPDAMAISFDTGRETFRTEVYSEYKAHRSAMPDTLREQMGLMIEGVKTFDIPVYQLKGFEADDIIGTIAHKAKELGHKSYILTGDQDSFQLVDKEEFIKVLIPSKGELIEYNRNMVFQKMGVWPEQIIDYKALRGDTSDNIPGIRGIGEKTAVKLLTDYDTLENVFEHEEEISGKSLKEKIKEGHEIAKTSKFLATIDLNVPIDFDFVHTHVEMPEVENVIEFLRKVEFRGLLKQLPEILKSFNGGIKPDIEEKLASIEPKQKPSVIPDQFQLGLFGISNQIKELTREIDTDYEIIDSEEKLKIMITSLKNAKIFSFDTETTSVNPLAADLVGLSFGWNVNIVLDNAKIKANNNFKEGTKTAYIPVGHQNGTQLDRDFVIKELKEIFEDEQIKKILQNAKYEVNILSNYNVALNGILMDTMVASYVKAPTTAHGLKAQAFALLDYDMQDIKELIGTGNTAITMDKVEIDKAAYYACCDAKATLELAAYYSLNTDDCEQDLIYNIETPLTKVLAEMERAGVCIDKDYLAKFSVELQEKISILEKAIYKMAGEEFNVNSPKQVGYILFEKLGLPAKGKAKTKTGYSTSAKVLEALANYYEIAQKILEHRHLSKLKSTYIDTLPELISPKDNRVHASFNQTVTTTGRLSSSNPNMQNIPIRTEVGNRIRAAFVPSDKENFYILSADYSQIELRLLAHISQDKNLMQAFCSDIDIHTATASKVFDVPIEDVTKEMRRKAKAVNFGIIYGQTSYGLSEAIGITPSEAKTFIDKYFETYPKINEYMQKTKQYAYENGFVTTIYGRKRYLHDELSSGSRLIREFGERAAINAPLQGTSADLIKIAMIELSKKLKQHNLQTKMIIQVHDELVLEVPKNELEQAVRLTKEAMELGQPFAVPLKIDIQVGQSWLEGSEDVPEFEV